MVGEFPKNADPMLPEPIPRSFEIVLVIGGMISVGMLLVTGILVGWLLFG